MCDLIRDVMQLLMFEAAIGQIQRTLQNRSKNENVEIKEFEKNKSYI